jgi:hypothetical protein
MTLTRLLEITLRLVKPDELASVGLAEQIWRQQGSPTGVSELVDLLEQVISECGKVGMRYAPIFLQRKKVLLRGTWIPQAGCEVSPNSATNAVNTNEGGCSKCGGSGYVVLRGGTSMSLCSCEAWKKQPTTN